MKYIIVSDIHGAFPPVYRLIEAFVREKADKIIILGDVLYHGPRNDLPLGYSPKDVFNILNKYSDKIIAVRGNCDAKVDECVFDFSIENTSLTLLVDGKNWLLTHGDDEEIMNSGKDYDVVLSGHTHLKIAQKKENTLYINPGSISIPKDNFAPGYVIYESGNFSFCDLLGNVQFTKKID